MALKTADEVAEQIADETDLSAPKEDAYLDGGQPVIVFVERYDGMSQSVEEFMSTINNVADSLDANVEIDGIGHESVRVVFTFETEGFDV